jgi:hypothetical protein
MVNIVVEIVDEHLRASVFMRPNDHPHLTYQIEGEQVDVWVEELINLDDEDVVDEIDNLIWATVLTMSAN